MMQEYKAVCYGEILWDVLPSGAKPGGAPMNVAYHLQKLGVTATLISKIGKDSWGNELIALLQKQTIDTGYIQIDLEHATGMVNAYIREGNEVEYDIVFPVAWDFISMQQALISLVQQAKYFVFGSLASRNDVSGNTLLELLEAANTKVLDINLRSPHFKRNTLETLLNKADILKLNEHEVNLIAGWLSKFDSLQDRVKSIQEHFEIATILVTRGGHGALVNERGNFYEHPGYKVRVEDTVGSGDAFLAAYLFKLDNNKTPQESLAFANALGAFIATQPGACPIYSLEMVYDLIEKAS
jgi:fructokinase